MPLGTVEPLVPRHGNERSSQLPHVDGNGPGGLGGIHDQRNPPLPTDPGNLPDRQNISKHIGDMGTDHRIRILRYEISESPQHSLLIEQSRIHHMDLQIGDGMEGDG